MAKQKKGKKQGRKKSKLLYLVGFILLVVILSFGAVLFLLGMLPAFVASYVDTTEDRNHFRVVAACNFSGVLPYLAQLVKKGDITSSAVYDLLFDPEVWLVMYGAAGVGWFLVWFFPRAVHFVLNLVRDSGVKTLRERQQQIVDEWGMEVETTSNRALRNMLFAEENKAGNQKDA